MEQKGIILFQSKYGAARKYAEWLAQMTGFACIEVKKADIEEVEKYDTIVLGGGIYASGIAGLPFLKKYADRLLDKKLAVFCVGASPYDEKAFEEIRRRNFKDRLACIPCFYCRGAWMESRMSFKDRTLCGLLKKMVAKQDPATYEPWQKALMEAIASGEDYDWTDRDALIPLAKFIRSSEG